MDWLTFREPVSAWTHFAWMVLAMPGTWVLWRLSRGDLLKRIGLSIFGATLLFCYAASGLFHSVPARLAGEFATFDHIGIYLFIAGTVTPVGLVLLRGRLRVGVVAGIWVLALLGIVLRLTAELSIRELTVCYLAMSWLACMTYLELMRRLPASKLRPILLGGLFYSAGAVLNGVHWPVLVPHVLEWHEIFHLCVMVGTLFHYYFMLSAVLPYRPSGMLGRHDARASLPARHLREPGR
jgi:hemolysin III